MVGRGKRKSERKVKELGEREEGEQDRKRGGREREGVKEMDREE